MSSIAEFLHLRGLNFGRNVRPNIFGYQKEEQGVKAPTATCPVLLPLETHFLGDKVPHLPGFFLPMNPKFSNRSNVTSMKGVRQETPFITPEERLRRIARLLVKAMYLREICRTEQDSQQRGGSSSKSVSLELIHHPDKD